MPDVIAPGPASPRRRDSTATRRAILDAAFAEFSDHGLSGSRVDAIARRTGTNVRMIYYYFGSKDGLYSAVLEQAYADMREAEHALQLDTLPPKAAIAALCCFVFDYHEANPRFARLVTIENIHRADHMRGSEAFRGLNVSILEQIGRILERGRLSGEFKADAAAIDVHLLITAYPFFRVANRHTLSAIFAIDTLAADSRDAHRRMLVDAVLGFLQQDPNRPQPRPGRARQAIRSQSALPPVRVRRVLS